VTLPSSLESLKAGAFFPMVGKFAARVEATRSAIAMEMDRFMV
jgi:hypothetical protein